METDAKTGNTTSRNAIELLKKWEAINCSAHTLGDTLAAKTSGFPEISHFSPDTDFRDLVNAISSLRNEISDLNLDIDSQCRVLGSDLKYFSELAKDYEEEISIFKKGRDQAFELYDKLSEQHRELMREHEAVKADIKSSREDSDETRKALKLAQDELAATKQSRDALAKELSTVKSEMATVRKRVGTLEEENSRMFSDRSHSDKDHKQLADELAKAIKSRDEALVLAEGARRELSRLLGSLAPS
jgi:chromosome segregation ATPase